MADEKTNGDLPDLDSLLDQTDGDDALPEGFGDEDDPLGGQQLSSKKVELDTAGLDLDLEEPEEAPPELDLEPDEPAPAREFDIENDQALAGAGEKPARPGWFKLVLFGGAGAVVVGLVLVIGLFTWWAKEEPAPPPEAAKAPQVVVTEKEIKNKAPTLSLTGFMVPLTGAFVTQLQVSVNLTLASDTAKLLLETQRTKVRNIIYQVLLSQTGSDLKEESTREIIKESLQTELNAKLAGGPVLEVFFTEYVVI